MMGEKQEKASSLLDSHSMQASLAQTTGTKALEWGLKRILPWALCWSCVAAVAMLLQAAGGSHKQLRVHEHGA